MPIAKEEDLISILLRLGTQTVRAKRLLSLSREYLKDPPLNHDPRPSRPSTPVRCTTKSPQKRSQRYTATPVSHLPGAGTYALDSYRIFCTVHDDPTSTEWQRVLPSDKELKRYLVRSCTFHVNLSLNPNILLRCGNGQSKSTENGHRLKGPVNLHRSRTYNRSSHSYPNT